MDRHLIVIGHAQAVISPQHNTQAIRLILQMRTHILNHIFFQSSVDEPQQSRDIVTLLPPNQEMRGVAKAIGQLLGALQRRSQRSAVHNNMVESSQQVLQRLKV